MRAVNVTLQKNLKKNDAEMVQEVLQVRLLGSKIGLENVIQDCNI